MTVRANAPNGTDACTPATPPAPGHQFRLRAEPFRVLAVFLAFAGFAAMSLKWFGAWEGPAFFYPAAGVASAALMLSHRARWPLLLVAVVAAEFLVDALYPNPAWVTAGFVAANVAEAVVGASLVLGWCGGRPDLGNRRDFAGFIVGACLIAPLVGGLIGGSVTSVDYGSSWVSAVLTWWAGDALGVLVVATPILLWTTQSVVVRRRPWELAGILVATAALSVSAFWTDVPRSIVILPVLAFAAFRLNMLGAALAGALAAILANLLTSRVRWLSGAVHASPESQVALTQIYVAVIFVVALLIAQEAAARQSAVREHEIERRERIRLETLSRLAAQLSAALTPEDIAEALADQVLNEAGAKSVAMSVLDADGRMLECVATAGFPESGGVDGPARVPLSERSLAVDVVKSGQPVEFGSMAEYLNAYPEQLGMAGRVGSIVGWPLSSDGQQVGVLVVVWPDSQPMDSQPMDDAQRAYISAVSTIVSQALVRARIYADERARALVLHSVAQPTSPVEVAGMQYQALYQPADAAHGLGGDWYSVMSLPDGRTYLAIGDVIGHGLLSVEDMVQLRSTGNAYAHLGMAAGQMLTEMNHFAASHIRGDFATNLVVLFDPGQFTLSYSSAGHLPPFLRRAATGEVVRLAEASGPMLGPFDDAVYVQSTVAIEPGDVLVMYTDGLVEHYDEDLKAGIAHLEHVLEAWPPEALLDCEALVRVVGPDSHDDDLCLLVVRFGAPATN